MYDEGFPLRYQRRSSGILPGAEANERSGSQTDCGEGRDSEPTLCSFTAIVELRRNEDHYVVSDGALATYLAAALDALANEVGQVAAPWRQL